MTNPNVIAYNVVVEFSDPQVAKEWEAWLVSEHLAEVVAAGAQDAMLVRMDGQSIRYEARYRFSSRAAFDKYLKEKAPALREKGHHRFPPERGPRAERTVGEILAVR